MDAYKELAKNIKWKDGKPYFIEAKCNSVRESLLAGTVNVHGYRVLHSIGKYLYAHRLRWYMEYGKLPSILDHINRDRDDNRIENLREASHSQNMRNKVVSIGKSKYRGVTLIESTGRWRSKVYHKRKQYHIGVFSTEIEAAIAYNNKVIELGLEEFTELNQVEVQIGQ